MRRAWRPIDDLKDTPTRLIALLLLVIMALANVRPVGHIDAAVGAVFGVHAAEPRVLRVAKIGGVFGDVAAAVRLKNVAVEALAVDVEHEGIAAILGGPVVA